MKAATCDRRSLEEASHAMGTSKVFLVADSIGPMLPWANLMLKTQWGFGLGDHGEVVEWLEPECVCASVRRANVPSGVP